MESIIHTIFAQVTDGEQRETEEVNAYNKEAKEIIEPFKGTYYSLCHSGSWGLRSRVGIYSGIQVWCSVDAGMSEMRETPLAM